MGFTVCEEPLADAPQFQIVHLVMGKDKLKVDKVLRPYGAWLCETMQFLSDLMRDAHERNGPRHR